MFEALKADLALYDEAPSGQNAAGNKVPRWLKRIVRILFRSEIRAIICYRYGHWAHKMKAPSGPLRPVGEAWRLFHRVVHFVWSKRSNTLTGIQLPATAEIGSGLFIAHPGLGNIQSDSVIGANLIMYPGALVGGDHSREGAPVLGDNVTLGAGSKVLGPVRVGSNVIIGANAVVVTDIPDNSVAVGIPARVKKQIWSEKQADGTYQIPGDTFTLPTAGDGQEAPAVIPGK